MSRRSAVTTLLLALGLLLLVYMIAVEGEPGALPLLLIAAGLGGKIAARVRARSRRG